MNSASEVIHTKTFKGLPSTDCEVVVLGAGPYGLSTGMFLKSRNIEVRVFGEPMDFWATKMPKGMLLRSPREASSIADPENAYTLEAYEAASGTKPVAPLPIETFVRYGRWFQQRLGSVVEPRIIEEVRQSNGGFSVTFQDGEAIRSKRVVVAAGIGVFRRKPQVFRDVPAQLVSHCYEGRELAEFTGKRVAVIGAGQSALESAALLHEAGAQVELIAKIPALRWIGRHKWLHQLGPITTMLYSKYDVGPAGISRLVAYPRVVSQIPLPLKDKIRVRAVRPAGSRWLPPRLVSVNISTGRFVQSARALGNEIELKLDDDSERRVDHVLLGTGYDVDISKYNFLAPELVGSIQRLNGYPDLSRGFASSVPGLHFVGATAARSFGPLLYFVAGTEYAGRELASYIAARNSVR